MRRIHKNPPNSRNAPIFEFLLVFQEKHSEFTKTPRIREPACGSGCFPSFSLENKLFGIHQTSFFPVQALEFSELKTPLVYTFFPLWFGLPGRLLTKTWQQRLSSGAWHPTFRTTPAWQRSQNPPRLKKSPGESPGVLADPPQNESKTSLPETLRVKNHLFLRRIGGIPDPRVEWSRGNSTGSV